MKEQPEPDSGVGSPAPLCGSQLPALPSSFENGSFISTAKVWSRSWSSDDPRLPERFPQLDLERASEFLTVCDRLGRVREGVEAMRQLTRHVPALRRLQWVYRLPGVTPTLRGIYRTAQRHRKKLCLSCGEKWMPSLKYSRRKKNSRAVDLVESQQV